MPFFAHNGEMLDIYNSMLHGCYIANDPRQFVLTAPEFIVRLTDRDEILDHTKITEYQLHLTKVVKLEMKGYEGRTLPSFLLFRTMNYDSHARVLTLELDPAVEIQLHVELLSAELNQV